MGDRDVEGGALGERVAQQAHAGRQRRSAARTSRAARSPGAHGAVHVAQPVVGGLGPGEVDLADRAAQPRPVLGQHARRHVGDGAAARPALLGPVLLEVVDGRARLVADEGGEALEHLRTALVGRQRRPTARTPSRRRSRRARRPSRRAASCRRSCARAPTSADPLTAQPRVAPERAIVDRRRLGQAARDERREQLRLALGQRRRVGQPRRERRRHGEDRLARLDRHAAGHDAHAVAVLRDDAHGRLEDDALAKAVGDLLADQLRAADEAALLRAAAGGDQAQERAGVRRRCRPRRCTAGRRAARAPWGRRPRSTGTRR